MVDVDDARKRINTEAVGAKPTASDRAELAELCRAFLKIQVPKQNIVSQEHFLPYEKLFNQAEVDKMSVEEQKALYKKYWLEFSLQHPIKVYGGVVDDPSMSKEEVIYVEADEKYHVVNYTVPPVFRQTKTLNELGQRVPSLIDALFNANAKSDNPISKADFEEYGIQIQRALEMANPEALQKADEEKAAAMDRELIRRKGAEHTEETQEEPAKNSQDDADAMKDDIFDW